MPKYPASIAIAAATLLVSLIVATAAQGAPWATVPVVQLLNFGGVNAAQLAHGELWRLAAAQLVHVKQAHMLFHVAGLVLLGFAIERNVGSSKLVLLWLLAGGVGVATSVWSANPPFDIGSGASQALMAFAAAALLILLCRLPHPRWLALMTLIAVSISLGLDIHAVGHLKAGHVSGFLAGLLLTAIFVSNLRRPT